MTSNSSDDMDISLTHHTKTSTPKKGQIGISHALDQSFSSTLSGGALLSKLESLSLHSEPVSRSVAITRSTCTSTSNRSAASETLPDNAEDGFQELPTDSEDSTDSESETKSG